MSDFKVKCIKSTSNATTVGKIYNIESGKIRWDSGITDSESFNSVDELNARCLSKFELVPDLPRICYILGGEDNPLKVGEKFNIIGYLGADFWVEQDGIVRYSVSNNYACTAADSVQNAINHPEKIIRQPQFSEDEKSLMRLYILAGYPWVARDEDGTLSVYSIEPSKMGDAFDTLDGKYENTCAEFLPSITFEGSPFNSAAYLEGLK